MITKLKTIIFLLLMVVSLSVSAVTTFSDNFNRHNSKQVGPGWFEIEKNINDIRIKNEEVILRDNKRGDPDVGLFRILDGDYTSSLLSFDWKPLVKSDWNDKFTVSFAEIKEGVDPLFTELFTTGLGDNSKLWNSVILSLSGTPVNSPFILLFSTDLDGRKNRREGVKLDNITISNVSNVPIPPVGLLIGAIGSLLLIKRKNRNEN